MPRPSSNQSFHGGLNVAFISIRYNILQQQHIPIFRSTFLSLFVPVILNFLELKYQGKDFSPFQTHPRMMRVAVVSLLLYCFAYDFEKRLCSSDYAHIVCCGRAVFGSLLSVSLASVLFQDSVCVTLFFVYILFSNWEILNHRVKGMCNWLQRRMNRTNLLPV